MNKAARERQRERCRANRRKNRNYNSYKQTTRTRLRLKIARIKESQPCLDCGFYFPAPIMEFDHRPGVEKVDTIARMVVQQRSWKVIEAEMAKCDLVCANCHRYRTHCSRDHILKPKRKPPKGYSD